MSGHHDGDSSTIPNRQSILRRLDPDGDLADVDPGGDGEFDHAGSGDGVGGQAMRTRTQTDWDTRLSEASWILNHTDGAVDTEYRSGYVADRDYYRTHHSIAYLGGQWSDYGNPAGDSERSGAWKHTFVLHSYTFHVDEDPGSDGSPGSIDSDPVGDLEPGSEVQSGRIEVDVAESEQGPVHRENVAVSLRRNGNLFHFFHPDAFEELLQTEVEVQCETGDCDEDLLGEMPMMELLAKTAGGSDRSLRATFDDYQVAIQRAQDEQSEEAMNAAMEELFKMGATFAIAWACSNPVTCGLGMVGVGLLDILLSGEEQPEPEVTFTRGFEKDYDPSNGPGIGHQMLFDVYAPPDPNKKGTFTVKSHHDVQGPGRTSHSGSQPAQFNAAPQWEIEVPGAPPPSDGDQSYPRNVEYQPKPLSPDPESEHVTTNVPVDFAYRSIKPPAADFTMDPELPNDGETVRFDASDTRNRGMTIDSYEWSVWTYDCEGIVPVTKQFTRSGETFEESFEKGCYVVKLQVETKANTEDAMWRSFEVGERETETAVRGSDDVLDGEDLKTSRDLWAADEPVPGTGGETLDTDTLQELTTGYNDSWDLFQEETDWGVKDG